MTVAHVLGFPRIGAGRELKFALEAFWRGEISESQLCETGAILRKCHWALQATSGLDYVTVGDFAWYDHIATTTCLFGAVAPRFSSDGRADLAMYFDMARGNASQHACPLKKWFDTNYHYLVPELTEHTRFALDERWLLPEVDEALALGHRVKVALPGPFTWLYLSVCAGGDKLSHLDRLVEQYATLACKLRERSVSLLQLDEPVLALDVPAEWLARFPHAYRDICAPGVPVMFATYFGDVSAHAHLLKRLPVAVVHLDLVRSRDQLDVFINGWPSDKALSLGVVDGRNVWRADFERALAILRKPHITLGDRLWISSSCSLLHVPIDLDLEKGLDSRKSSWLAFAKQKLREIAVLKAVLDEGEESHRLLIHAASAGSSSRRRSDGAMREDVRSRIAKLDASDLRRAATPAARIEAQRQALQLPPLPTTTIGSFPQTDAIRKARADFRRGQIDSDDYSSAMFAAIGDAIQRQETLGLDVLVHGEPERNDMVEYFAEHLDGFLVTQHGWVQSYGSRCVKPPIIAGDVARPNPITLGWTSYARTLTRKPVKGMLTGPVTMMAWSFVRDDLPHRDVALQIALALRDEVMDLEESGVPIIQIDEPALRERLPLKRNQWGPYLRWAAEAFRVVSAKVRPETQIHTHMCYSQFEDILSGIAELDADVVTVETARSPAALLKALTRSELPSAIGPGVYDIHSPRVPEEREMAQVLELALEALPPQRVWVNPDCGLKTRGWRETEVALARMVAVARRLRERAG